MPGPRTRVALSSPTRRTLAGGSTVIRFDRDPSPNRNIGVIERPYRAAMDVALLRWPEDSSQRAQLEMVARPRLLLVEPGQPPPDCRDPLEDWIRLPADDQDIRARLATLVTRSGTERPTLDEDGLLWFRGSWVSLSPLEQSLAGPLIERFGAVAGRDTLRRQAWPEGLPSRNALDVHMVRLRRRIAALALEVRTVRSRGYLLQAVDPVR